MPEPQLRSTEGAVAYILKGYPRMSELFIASEIERLEQAGVPLRLFVLKPADEVESHQVVERIRATPDYLPATTSLSATTAYRWLAVNGGKFTASLGRVAQRRPVGLACAAAAAFAQAVRARKTFWPRKLYLKEFLQAVALADRLLGAPDVRHLHAHFCHGATTVAWLASMITGLPFSFTAHAKDLYAESLNPAGLLRRKLAAARFAVTCTEANRAHLAWFGLPTPIYRMYHGLNADFSRLLAQAPQQPSPNAGQMRLLGVGRLVPKKGFDLFVEACGILRRRGVALEALIVGERGEHAAEIERRIAALGLEGVVRLGGPLGQDALYAEYRRATVFCLPCRVMDDGDRDGIPNVLVEAMACGLPVVTTAISGIPELVSDGATGLLVPPDSPAAIAEALECVHHDPALARRVGEAAASLIRAQFDGDVLALQLAALFREALRQPGPQALSKAGGLAG